MESVGEKLNGWVRGSGQLTTLAGKRSDRSVYSRRRCVDDAMLACHEVDHSSRCPAQHGKKHVLILTACAELMFAQTCYYETLEVVEDVK